MLIQNSFFRCLCVSSIALIAAQGCDGESSSTAATGGMGGATGGSGGAVTTAPTGGGGQGGGGQGGGGQGGGGQGGGTTVPGGPFALTFGGAANDAADHVAIDSNHRVIVAGQFGGSVDFGGGPLSTTGASDAFLVSLSPSLEHLWSIQLFSEGGIARIADVSTTPDDDVVVVGQFTGTIKVGSQILSSPAVAEFFIARLKSDGSLVWIRTADSPMDVFASRVRIDFMGNIVVSGSFNGALNFEGGAALTAPANSSFVASLEGDGTYRWSRALHGDVGSSSGGRASVGPDGSVVACGLFGGIVDLGGGPTASIGPRDMFVVRYDADGSYLAEANFAFDGTGALERVLNEVDSRNRTIVVGNFGDLVGFEPPLVGDGIQNDIFLAQLDENFVPVWSTSFASEPAGSDVASDVALSPEGEIVVVGAAFGPITFGGGDLPFDSISYFAKFSSAGIHLASGRVGSTLFVQAAGTAVDSNGSLVIVGAFDGSSYFGTSEKFSSQAEDGFVAKLSP